MQSCIQDRKLPRTEKTPGSEVQGLFILSLNESELGKTIDTLFFFLNLTLMKMDKYFHLDSCISLFSCSLASCCHLILCVWWIRSCSWTFSCIESRVLLPLPCCYKFMKKKTLCFHDFRVADKYFFLIEKNVEELMPQAV